MEDGLLCGWNIICFHFFLLLSSPLFHKCLKTINQVSPQKDSSRKSKHGQENQSLGEPSLSLVQKKKQNKKTVWARSTNSELGPQSLNLVHKMWARFTKPQLSPQSLSRNHVIHVSITNLATILKDVEKRQQCSEWRALLGRFVTGKLIASQNLAIIIIVSECSVQGFGGDEEARLAGYPCC